MKFSQYFKHAYTLLRRELGSGEFRLTLFALLIGVVSVTSLSLTTSRIQNAMSGQAADLIGGDVVVRSTIAIDDALVKTAESHGLDHSVSVSSFTMVSHDDEFLLSSVRAVDESYPLKGKVSTQWQRGAEPITERTRPLRGEAWVEERFLDRLDVEIGEQIEVGNAKFTVTRILELEPDRGGNLYSINPRVLINWQDLDGTLLVQPGSRLWYKLMLSGKPNEIASFKETVSEQLKPSQRLIEPHGREDQINDNLSRANAFINLGALLAVVLCGIAVSLAASRHAVKHVDQVALLRCFGLKSKEVNWIYTLQLLLLALPAILLGVVIGYLVHVFLMQLIAELFTRQLPSPSLLAWFSGPITALCMVLGFGLPPLLKLAKTPPARVFRKDLNASRKAPILGTLFAIAALILVAWWQTADLKLAVLTIAGLVVTMSVLSVAIGLLLKAVSKISLPSAALKGAFSNISSRPSLTAMQIVGFGVSLFAVALILFFRNDVFDQWNQQVPVDAPNRFVFDLPMNDRDAFAQILEENQIDATIFPTARGRLVKINDKVVQKAVSKEGDDSPEALNRDLSLTHTNVLPIENEIIEGQFIGEFSVDDALVPVSVESRLAEQLSLKLGDKLEFVIQGQSLHAAVSSLRSVNWENFRPNFYMIFPLGALKEFSQSNLTSFHLPKAKAPLDRTLNRTFVGASIINIDFIIKRIQSILNQISSAMELIFGMAVVAGLAVFWASLLVTFDEKLRQTALLRALGASRATVCKRFITEYSVIGFFAGALAASCLLVVSYLLSTRILDLPWAIPWAYVLSLPLIMMVLLSSLALFQLGGILKRPPYPVLKLNS
ncbi:MAG: putative ABC transport system permease protein [Saprospiraceae bacterium]|jgi:putative ABC transport system permease protein